MHHDAACVMRIKSLSKRVAWSVAPLAVVLANCTRHDVESSQTPGATASAGADHGRAATATFVQRPDSDNQRRYHAVSRRFLFIGERARDTSVLVRETVVRDCCWGGEKTAASTIRLDGWVGKTALERSPDWTDSLTADEGELVGSSPRQFYRATLRGCCDTADLLTFVSVYSGKPRFFLTRPDQPIGADLPEAFDRLNQASRFAAFHDMASPSAPPEAERDREIIGVLQYGPADGPVQRVVVRCADSSACDYQLDRIGFSENDTIGGAALEVGDGTKEHTAAEAFTDFAIIVKLRGMDLPSVSLRVPIRRDSLDLVHATLPTGFAVR